MKKEKKIMLFIVATNAIASRSPTARVNRLFDYPKLTDCTLLFTFVGANYKKLISFIWCIIFNCHQVSISAACVNYFSQRNRLNYQDLALNLVPEVLMTLIGRDAAPGLSLLSM